jgi:hypothetical protein
MPNKWTLQKNVMGRWVSMVQFGSQESAERFLAQLCAEGLLMPKRLKWLPENPERVVRDRRGRPRRVGVPQHA